MPTDNRTWGLRYHPESGEGDDRQEAGFSWGWGPPEEDVSRWTEAQIAQRYGQRFVRAFQGQMEAGGRTTVGTRGANSLASAGTPISAAGPGGVIPGKSAIQASVATTGTHPSPGPGLVPTAAGFQERFGAARGDPRYYPTYDLNNDGKIDMLDYSMFLQAATPGTPPGAGVGTSTSPPPPPPPPPVSIRSLRDILGNVAPGSALNLTPFTAQEIGKLLFDENGLPNAGNIMRGMGYEPSQGNPNVGFLESLIPKLGRQSELYHSFTGDLATAPGDTSAAAQQKGAEAQARLLGDVSGQMSQGATSAVTPQLGASFLKDLVGKMGLTAEERKNLGQENLFTQLVDQNNTSAPANSFQAVMDLIGGGLSPMLMGNQQLQNRMFSRLQEDWRNSGTSGGSFLSWLSRLVPGAA